MKEQKLKNEINIPRNFRERGLRFLKEWTLVIAILAGIAGYFIYSLFSWSPYVRSVVNDTIGIVQPLLIFTMLFLTFCKINPRDLRIRKWHIWLLAIQALFFVGIGCVLVAMPRSGLRIVLEGAMLCMICPTATAGAVITGRLGGSVNHITSYTILINLLNVLLIPVLVPFVHPNPGFDVWKSALLILSKVFPLLLLPLLSAFVVRKLFPRITALIGKYQGISFYLWAVALTLAIAVTTKSIVHAHIDLVTESGLVIISLLSCVFQFWIGRKIGSIYGERVTAGQSLGQKNTVLVIWMGYTFFTPVTAIVGGFYSIWHNIINSWQLYRHEHK